MIQLRLLILALLLVPIHLCARTPIQGKQKVTVERMYQFVSSRNPDFSREIAQAFFTVGERYGVRGDIALCQAIIETGWFRFDNGTAVKPSSHNYCGLGVKRRGDRGCSFSSVEEGVTAMIQHLFAYATRHPLPAGESMVDPRFSYVDRGCASTWEGLSGRWAMNKKYGKKILDIYELLEAHPVDPLTAYEEEPEIPDFSTDIFK